MGLLDTILAAGGGGAVGQLARQFGLDESQAQSAVSALLPAISQGFQKNASSEDGLNSLLGALDGGGHSKYLDDVSTLESEETTQDGNGILGHIFGSKDVSRAVASQASLQTGIGSDILKQMLPVVAAMAMGSLAKGHQSSLQAGAGGGGGLLDMLASGLDANQNGSALDDIIGMASKFLRK